MRHKGKERFKNVIARPYSTYHGDIYRRRKQER